MPLKKRIDRFGAATTPKYRVPQSRKLQHQRTTNTSGRTRDHNQFRAAVHFVVSGGQRVGGGCGPEEWSDKSSSSANGDEGESVGAETGNLLRREEQ